MVSGFVFEEFLFTFDIDFQVFVGSWLAYNVVYLLLMGLLVYGIALVRMFST